MKNPHQLQKDYCDILNDDRVTWFILQSGQMAVVRFDCDGMYMMQAYGKTQTVPGKPKLFVLPLNPMSKETLLTRIQEELEDYPKQYITVVFSMVHWDDEKDEFLYTIGLVGATRKMVLVDPDSDKADMSYTFEQDEINALSADVHRVAEYFEQVRVLKNGIDYLFPLIRCPICLNFVTSDHYSCPVCNQRVHKECFDLQYSKCLFCLKGGVKEVNMAKPDLAAGIANRDDLEFEDEEELMILVRRAMSFSDLDIASSRLKMSLPTDLANVSRRTWTDEDLKEILPKQIAAHFDEVMQSIKSGGPFPQHDCSQTLEYFLTHPAISNETLMLVIFDLLDTKHVRAIVQACSNRVIRALERSMGPKPELTSARVVKRVKTKEH